MNKTLLKISIGVIAFLLAGCAAFFSVAGLSKLFAGASIAVIVMASTLELSKLVIASFLYQYWTEINRLIKIYLTSAIIVIATITSVGIYGYLSASYQTTKLQFDLTQSAVDSLASKQTYYQTSIETFKLQLNQKNDQLKNLISIRSSQEQRSNQLILSNKSSKSADISSKRTENDLNKTNKELNDLNSKIVAYTDSVLQLQVKSKQASIKNNLSSELGSLTFLSKLFDTDMDRVVNVLILLFILVFDPLAICMVLAFNFLNHLKKPEIASIYTKGDKESPEKEPLIQSEAVIPNIESPILVKDDIRPENDEKLTNNSDTFISDKRTKLQKQYSGAVTI